MLHLSKSSYLNESAHELLMNPHMNIDIFWWFHTRILENHHSSSAFDLIVILSVLSKWYRYELGGNDDTPKLDPNTSHDRLLKWVINRSSLFRCIIWTSKRSLKVSKHIDFLDLFCQTCSVNHKDYGCVFYVICIEYEEFVGVLMPHRGKCSGNEVLWNFVLKWQSTRPLKMSSFLKTVNEGLFRTIESTAL